MRVNLGKYKSYVGPYQIAEKLLFWVDKYEDDRVRDFGKLLADTPLNQFCNWVHEKRTRTEKVHLDPWDTWNVDNTLSLIILPIILQLKEDKSGSPSVDDLDVPENLRSTSSKKIKENEWDSDEFYHERWTWVLEEMIWAFTQLNDDDHESKFFEKKEKTGARKFPDYKIDMDGLKLHNERISRGTTLFGKYFRALWT